MAPLLLYMGIVRIYTDVRRKMWTRWAKHHVRVTGAYRVLVSIAFYELSQKPKLNPNTEALHVCIAESLPPALHQRG